MKTTIDIPETLLRDARELAASERTTLRALVAEGLRTTLEQRRVRRAYRLDHVIYGDAETQPGVDLARWDQIRDLIHEDRRE